MKTELEILKQMVLDYEANDMYFDGEPY